jgi:hypothetical protein
MENFRGIFYLVLEIQRFIMETLWGKCIFYVTNLSGNDPEIYMSYIYLYEVCLFNAVRYISVVEHAG